MMVGEQLVSLPGYHLSLVDGKFVTVQWDWGEGSGSMTGQQAMLLEVLSWPVCLYRHRKGTQN